jgi:deoxyribodipyrimidine photo-lyase
VNTSTPSPNSNPQGPATRWNAAQAQLVRERRVRNYLRMLWGKKILERSRCPREVLSALIHLNNKYGLDGRDPNSYSCLGRYDRPGGPSDRLWPSPLHEV